ncbi:MAG: bifunctional demethylmenaquinone methyltransferase/2-methoxy-6-polyprenyl-1,4-benzoquinol methylase UbiE [Candidatus Margulisiibacteriota bacterium]
MHKKTTIWQVFNRIAPRYDLLNRLLSFGQDLRWRKQLVAACPETAAVYVDLATGTADVLLAVCQNRRIQSAIGLDPAQGMLDVGRLKLDKAGLSEATLVLGDAQHLPFETASTDLISMAFGIRNVPQPELALAEMVRVLKPGGKAIILEFSLPQMAIIRWVYLLYFRWVLPLVGGLISGDFQAYRYLNQSVENFPYGQDFLNLMRQAGFAQVAQTPLTFGIATLYVGQTHG